MTDAQVIVADNGSTDGTRSVAEDQAGLFIRPLIYLRAAETGDKGLAIRRGWESAPADCDVLAYCDADMATDPRTNRQVFGVAFPLLIVKSSLPNRYRKTLTNLRFLPTATRKCG